MINLGGMEKMVNGFLKSALRDPKKRAYVEKVMLESADTAMLQKYVNMKLYGQVIKEGEVISLDEKGDIPEILDRLDRLEKNQEEILRLLKKLAGEE